MSPKISIIIPVYNTEKYISRCVNSVIAQTFRDIEIILIDDGSIDNSGRICDEFAVRDARVHVIHQQNAGVSAARNAGIDAATGEWIGFVDSDDWIDANTYEVAYKVACEQNADMVVWGCTLNDGERDYSVVTCYEGILKPNMLDELSPSIINQAVQKLIKKHLLDKYNIRFPFGIRQCEDLYFSFLCLFYFTQNKKVYMLKNCFYHYFQNPESASAKINLDKINDVVCVTKNIECIIQSAKENKVWDSFLLDKKAGAKNNFIFELDAPKCNLWRKTFPEVNKKLLFVKDKKIILYWLLFLHLDFFAVALLNTHKRLKETLKHRNSKLFVKKN